MFMTWIRIQMRWILSTVFNEVLNAPKIYMCIGAGLGRIEEYLPPPPGENVSYRIWNLWCKENPASNLRMIVRSKVRIHSYLCEEKVGGGGVIILCIP